jgi:AcrR family transcriptional regulator
MTVRSRRRPGRPSGTDQVLDRATLLDVAERVIARDGSGASIDAIAREAGVTKPSVYARVGSRADLSNALAERLAERLMEAGRPTVADGRLDRDALAALFRSSLDTIGQYRDLFLFVTRGSADDGPERTLYLAGQSAAPLTELLAATRMQQGATPEVAATWAYGIIGMLNMVAVWWLNAGDRSAGEVADQLAELVWCGIGGDAGGTPAATVRGRRRS